MLEQELVRPVSIVQRGGLIGAKVLSIAATLGVLAPRIAAAASIVSVQPSQVVAGQDVTVSISFDANPSLHHPAASYQVIATDGGAPVTSFLWPSFVVGNPTDTLLFSSKPEKIGIQRDNRGAIKGRISHTFAQKFQIPPSAALRRAVYIIVTAAEFFDDGTFFFEVGLSDYLRQCAESKGVHEKQTDCVFKTPALIARQKATGVS